MGIVQNGYDQHGNAQDDLEFFVCTHKEPPLSARLGTGWEHVPPAARVSILYCQGGSPGVPVGLRGEFIIADG